MINGHFKLSGSQFMWLLEATCRQSSILVMINHRSTTFPGQIAGPNRLKGE